MSRRFLLTKQPDDNQAKLFYFKRPVVHVKCSPALSLQDRPAPCVRPALILLSELPTQWRPFETVYTIREHRMKMSSFSIRDILNLPEDRIRSLSVKGEDQMSVEERRSLSLGIPGPDEQDEDTSAQDIAKSSTNYINATEILIKLRARAVLVKLYL